MGIGQQTAKTLWTPVLNKTTGKPYVGLERCSSLEVLEKEDKQLSDLIDSKLNEWLEKDPSNEEALRDFKKGFSYKHTDGFTYKLIQFDNGNYALSRSAERTGGYGKGGYSKGSTYIHLRTVSAKIVRLEALPGIIDIQEANDNFEIIQLQPDKSGDKFLLLNKKPYTPTIGDTTSASKETTTTTSKENTEAEEESEDSVE